MMTKRTRWLAVLAASCLAFALSPTLAVAQDDDPVCPDGWRDTSVYDENDKMRWGPFCSHPDRGTLPASQAFAISRTRQEPPTPHPPEFNDICWTVYELSETYLGQVGPDDTGTNLQCLVYNDNLDGYLDYILAEGVDETYETREAYIGRLKQVAADNCRTVAPTLGFDVTDCDADEVRLSYLDPRRTNGQFSAEGARDEAVFEQWAIFRINGWHSSAGRAARGSVLTTPYYVYKVAIRSQATLAAISSGQQPARKPPPATPPATPPAGAVWQDGGTSSGTTSDDQYTYNDDGYFRRKMQSDGTYRCYFNGYDGSLANLGEC